MAIRRIATSRAGKGRPAFATEVDDNLIELEHADLTTFNTPAKVLAEVERLAQQSLPFFFHFNRDGSLAVATGAPPDVWPEDEPKE